MNNFDKMTQQEILEYIYSNYTMTQCYRNSHVWDSDGYSENYIIGIFNKTTDEEMLYTYRSSINTYPTLYDVFFRLCMDTLPEEGSYDWAVGRRMDMGDENYIRTLHCQNRAFRRLVGDDFDAESFSWRYIELDIDQTIHDIEPIEDKYNFPDLDTYKEIYRQTCGNSKIPLWNAEKHDFDTRDNMIRYYFMEKGEHDRKFQTVLRKNAMLDSKYNKNKITNPPSIASIRA